MALQYFGDTTVTSISLTPEQWAYVASHPMQVVEGTLSTSSQDTPFVTIAKGPNPNTAIQSLTQTQLTNFQQILSFLSRQSDWPPTPSITTPPPPKKSIPWVWIGAGVAIYWFFFREKGSA